MLFRLVPLLVFSSLIAQAAQPGNCEPAPAIRSELQRAAAAPVTDPTAFDKNIAPFLALRQRHPANLFVHERYQDAVRQYGIEGHLRVLTQEYQALVAEHADDLMYSYLSARARVGRSTPSAIADLTELLTDHPDFAPAHRTLAEIYESEAFHDSDKATAERQKSTALCPNSALAALPPPLPARSLLIDQAERLLAGNRDPSQAAALATQGVRDDEWRLQRIRPFDWYSVSFKRQVQQELQAEYWRVWSIQVGSYRRTGQPQKAAELLAVMEQRASRLNDHLSPIYWDSQATLAHAYIDGNQISQATAKLAALSELLNDHPDPDRASQLDDMKKLANGNNR